MLIAIFIWYALYIKVQKRPRKPYFSIGPNNEITHKLMWFLIKVDMRQFGCSQIYLNLYSLLSLQTWLFEGCREALIFGRKGCYTQTLLTHLGRDIHVPLPLGL